MQVFEGNYKINFIDRYDVFAGFDYSVSCCEHFGVIVSDEKPEIFDFYEVEDHSVDHLNRELRGYWFDTTFFEEHDNCLVLKVIKWGDTKYITMFNEHNGYYAHSYLFSDALSEDTKAVVHRGWL